MDRRVQRTRQLLQQSLIAQILERGYDTITVQNITDHANLGRATFYLHYRDKEELLVSTLESIYDDLVKQIGSISRADLVEGKAPPLALIAFQHAEQHRDLYRIMLRGQGVIALVGQLRTYLAAAIQGRIQQLFPAANLSVPYEVIAQHMTGSLLALLSWWLENETRFSPEAMAEMYQQLNAQALIPYFRSRVGPTSE